MEEGTVALGVKLVVVEEGKVLVLKFCGAAIFCDGKP